MEAKVNEAHYNRNYYNSFFLLVITGCGSEVINKPKNIHIYGTVIDYNGDALDNVKIISDKYSTSTNSKGEYDLNITTNSSTIKVIYYKSGYKKEVKNIEYQKEKEINVHLQGEYHEGQNNSLNITGNVYLTEKNFIDSFQPLNSQPFNYNFPKKNFSVQSAYHSDTYKIGRAHV